MQSSGFASVPELITPRVRLRGPTLEDAESLLQELYSHREIFRYAGQDAFTRLEQMQEKLQRDLDLQRRGEMVRWVMVKHEDARVVGYAGYFNWSQRDRRTELGYMVARALWGQGVMREVLPAMLEFGFDVMGLNRIEAHVDPRNAASLRVLERVGFRQEGFLRETVAIPGGYADTALLALLAHEARAKPAAQQMLPTKAETSSATG